MHTALHFAADRHLEPKYVDAALMEVLLRAGADATIRNKQGRTALDLLISLEDAMEDVGEGSSQGVEWNWGPRHDLSLERRCWSIWRTGRGIPNLQNNV